jgi:glycosyltransferase involved in cell wall biosynthesis
MIERVDRQPALVSVVVPARDAARTLVRQLDAIAEQDYAGPWELVVAVNGGRDGTNEVAADWIGRRRLGRLVDASGRTAPGHARNRGAAAAAGDFLAFCDADDVVSREWLRALVAAARSADIVTGPHSPELLNAPPVRSCQSVMPPHKPFHAFLPIAAGSNCGVWREVFDALDGFDERRLPGEDVCFSWRAQLRGFRFAVADEALVHKRFRPSRLAMARAYFRYGIGDVWLYSRYRSAGMPRRDRRAVLREWRAIALGLPAHAGTPGRWGRVMQGAALAGGRLTASVRYRALYL